MSLDVRDSYDKANEQIEAYKSYLSAKAQYVEAKIEAGNSKEENQEETERMVIENLGDLKTVAEAYKKAIIKNQFERLLDMLISLSRDTEKQTSEVKKNIAKAKTKVKDKINGVASNIDKKFDRTKKEQSNTARYIKRTLLKVLKIVEPRILEILNQEILTAVGCDQEQTFDTTNPIYIKVKSIDIINILKTDPNSKSGKVMYEKASVQIQTPPFSMNRELYHRIQTPTDSYLTEYGQKYVGKSGQPLFNIQYFEQHPVTGESGGWFEVTLYNRYNNINRVTEFMFDYYKTIKLFEFQNIIALILENLSGMLSIQGNFGISYVTDAKKFERIMMRILGLCFDEAKEIDVSGVSKVSEVPIDDSFFEFSELDLRLIEQEVQNVKNGVVEFEDCDNIKLPVDSDAILDSIAQLLFVPDSEQIAVAESVTDSLSQNPVWDGVAINAQLKIDFDFIKAIIKGLVSAIISPKVLLPIFIMLKALKNNAAELDLIDSYVEFCKKFRIFIINLVSKVGGIFIQELFNLIKKDIKNLLQQIVIDVAKEQGDKRIIMVLKLTQLLIVVAQGIADWRRCKSVIDEILWLLKIATTGFSIPLPLLFASQLLDGYSSTRAFTGALAEFQKVGIPVGPMPDGSPNLFMLSKYSQMLAMSNEEAENGKVQVGIPPLTLTPAGQTVPASASGKKI